MHNCTLIHRETIFENLLLFCHYARHQGIQLGVKMKQCSLQFTVRIHYNPVRYYLHSKEEKTGLENLNDLATSYTASKW